MMVVYVLHLLEYALTRDCPLKISGEIISSILFKFSQVIFKPSLDEYNNGKEGDFN